MKNNIVQFTFAFNEKENSYSLWIFIEGMESKIQLSNKILTEIFGSPIQLENQSSFLFFGMAAKFIDQYSRSIMEDETIVNRIMEYIPETKNDHTNRLETAKTLFDHGDFRGTFKILDSIGYENLSAGYKVIYKIALDFSNDTNS